MGAGASAQRTLLVEKLPKCTDYTKAFEDMGGAGILGEGIDFDAFKDGVKELGFEVKDDEVIDYFRRFKVLIADNPKQVAKARINGREFFQFLLLEATAQQAEAAQALDKYKNMHEILGPIEAAHGYPTAHALLEHKPEVAKELWFPPDTQADDELFTARTAEAGWNPVHLLLVSGGNSTIVKAEAPPLLKKLLEKFPEFAEQRIQPELGLEGGHLPLYLALQYGWDVDTVKCLLGANPDAQWTMSVMQKNKGKAPSLKNSTWARKIAVDFDAAPAVLDLLPEPKKANKKQLDLPTVHGGFNWQHEAASA
jgi:hypothetical protein